MTILSSEPDKVNPPAPAEPYTVKTAISQVHPDRILTRGYNLVDVAEHYSFGDAVFMVLSIDSSIRMTKNVLR